MEALAGAGPETKVIILDRLDNVATAIANIAAGDDLNTGLGKVVAIEAIPLGYKMALRPIRTGEAILKYGAAIGVAKGDIAQGACVHVHNVTSSRALGECEG